MYGLVCVCCQLVLCGMMKRLCQHGKWRHVCVALTSTSEKTPRATQGIVSQHTRRLYTPVKISNKQRARLQRSRVPDVDVNVCVHAIFVFACVCALVDKRTAAAGVAVPTQASLRFKNPYLAHLLSWVDLHKNGNSIPLCSSIPVFLCYTSS